MRSLLASMIITVFSYGLALATEVGDCTERAPKKRALSGEVAVKKDDWSWKINEAKKRVTLEIYNSSVRPIRAITFTETNTSSVSNVDWYIPAGSRESFNFSVSSKVIEKGGTASIKAYEYTHVQGACIDRYTVEDRERELIFNNCVVSKTKGGGLRSAAVSACNTIADDPSFLDKLRFGS
ncbi:hypothetical protein N9S22_01570 [Paracoccaceae bacterium]|nr:hypothetical protein [Paracoccaceae bacterium]